MQANRAGFSLIELLIVVVIVSLLIGIGVPGYRQYVQRANRTDATAALLRIAAAQERFYLQNGRYASNVGQMNAPPPGGLGIESTERGYYTLDLESEDEAVDFPATATPLAGSNQADDTECWTFQIDERGLRQVFDQGGDENGDFCWR